MNQHLRFGCFRFEPASSRLFDQDAEIKLTPKAAQVLAALLEQPGAPLSKQELFDRAWRGTIVSDDALVSCIQELRKALGDDSKNPRFIETRHRLGYRFAAAVQPLPAERRGISPAPAAEAAIAVLPFADMSAGRDLDYLCEGLAEELIDALTHIDDLRVAARTSSFQFRGDHDLRDVGRRLGVRHLLEGSVRKSGDVLRITVQLIDAETGYHRWSGKFERSAADVFAVQEEIAATVVSQLRGGSLTSRERRAVRRQSTAIDTYECFLRARQRMHSMQQPHMDEARDLYRRAIAFDAEYAPAWAGLATLHALLYEWWGSKPEDRDEADRSSRIALELAPELADSHLARGYALSIQRRYEDARPNFEAATRINPNLFDAYYYYGRAAFAAGDIERAAEAWRKAAEVRREDFESPLLQALALRRLGRIDESVAVNRESVRRAERLLDINPLSARVLSFGAGALLDDGQPERAMEWARRAEQLYPDDMGVIINGACLRARLGLKDEALDLLERVLTKGWGKKDWIIHDPDYDSLRSEPRFIAMLEKLS
jgi:adenylate cyclase